MQSLVVVTEPEGSQRLARIVVSGPTTQRISNRPARHDIDGDHTSHANSHNNNNNNNNDHHRHYTPSSHARKLLGGGPPSELNLSAFQEHMAFSYFFATYGWAYFWKPFLQLARENDLAPTASHTCTLALAYGHMGMGHGDKALKSMGLEYYGRSMREVQALLTRGAGAEARTQLARLCVPIVILGMYSVCASMVVVCLLSVSRVSFVLTSMEMRTGPLGTDYHAVALCADSMM